MDAETLTALRKSIRKWERIACGTGVDNGYSNCALCQRFYFGKEARHSINRSTGESCKGCPVREETGNMNCVGSPYHAHVDAERRYERAMTKYRQAVRQNHQSPTLPLSPQPVEPKRPILSALRVVEFLVRLLPPEAEL